MHDILKKMRKHWITVWLVVCVFAFASFGTYAAFTRINIVKRVVSTDAGAGARFSSDCMNSSTSGMITRKSFSSQSDVPTVTVNVFNYPYPKASLYRNAVTEYDVVATIGTHDGTTFTALAGEDLAGLSNDYYMNYNNGTNRSFNASSGTLSFDDCRMAAGKVNPDTFNIHFDAAELGDNPPGYCVEVIATPKDTSLPVLKGYISVRYVKSAETGWTGSLEELDDNKVYDGYNYILEGSGAGRITFSWNPTYLTINKQFLQNLENEFYVSVNGTPTKISGNSSLTEDSSYFPTVNGMKSITLVVDSQNKNRYEVQFYKTNTSGNFNYQNSAIVGYLPDSTEWVEVTGES